MPVINNARFNCEDIFIDYPFEEVMFHWDYKQKKVYRRFYGDLHEEVVPYENRLFNDAILEGDEVPREFYMKGKPKT